MECIPADVAADHRRAEDSHDRHRRGAGCDGQILVFHDLLGLTTGHVPRHVKTYANLKDTIVSAVTQYRDEVRQGKFPGPENAFS